MPKRKLWKAIVIERFAQVSNYRIYSALTVFRDCSRAAFISLVYTSWQKATSATVIYTLCNM